MSEKLIWFIWSLALIVCWLIVYLLYKDGRKRMLWASLYTMPFGLTEPLFVPEYWNPPSLFDLAQNTGFDIESLIFCFGIGGLGVVLYDFIFKVQHTSMSIDEKSKVRHRFHFWVLISPIILFPFFYFSFGWNVIYVATFTMFLSAIAALWCRPDLKAKIWVSGLIFTLFYLVYFLTLISISPGYVDRVWTLKAISGIELLGIPIEELIFAFTFGMLWASFYEHISWHKIQYATKKW